MGYPGAIPQMSLWQQFVVYTDKNLLTYILTSVKLDVTGHHWVASLANCNFVLSY